jgi:hypothetical protein
MLCQMSMKVRDVMMAMSRAAVNTSLTDVAALTWNAAAQCLS